MNDVKAEAWKNTADDSQGEAWPQPRPIEKALPPVDMLPEGILPDTIARWIADIAHRMQVPADFPAVTAIVMLGSVVGNRIGIKPKEKDDWIEVPNVWGCIVGSPSIKKTPSMSEVLKPLKCLETEASENHKNALLDYKAKGERKKIELDLIKKKGKTGKEVDLDKVEKEIKEAMRDDEQPTRKRFLTNDATTEKIGVILNENPGGILVFRDELIGLLTSFDKAGREQDRAFYLEAWNGKGTFSVDRVGRPDLFIKSLCISLCGTIQPARLAGYFHDVGSHGNDGMIQRFQLIVYPDPLRSVYIDQYPDTIARDKAKEVIEVLAGFDYGAFGKHDRFEPIPYRNFTPDAQPVFKEWFIKLEELLESGELSPLLEEHFAKYRSLVPSLALLFHLVDYVAGATETKDVTLSALEKAIQFTDYLKSHAKRIYALFGDEKQYAAYELSKRIAEGELGESFKARDVVRKGWHSLSSTEKVSGAIEELTEADWLIKQRVESTPGSQGGRPEAPVYLVNPLTLKIYKNA